MQTKQAFGTWASPLTAEKVTTAGVRLGDVAYQNGAAFWAETRPQDNGRCTIVKALPGDAARDLIADPFNVRTQVHEYGGGSWWVDQYHLFFVHWDDQRLYRVAHTDPLGASPQAISPEPDAARALRYADGCISPDGQWIVCVHETHAAGSAQAENQVIAMRNDNGRGASIGSVSEKPRIIALATGADFYSTPRFSPDGSKLSWIQWCHPQMPWDGTELMLADVRGDMQLHNSRKIAGATDISVMGALWSRHGDLVYASDESGWWNLYQLNPGTGTQLQRTAYTDREVGIPAWVFGTQRFVELTESENGQEGSGVVGDRFALLVTHQARDQLQLLDANGELTTINNPYASISSMAAGDCGQLIVQGQTETEPASIQLIDCNSRDYSEQCIKPAESLDIDTRWISRAQAMRFPSGERIAHAFFYPPAAINIAGLDDERPPLLVMGHGGPTSHAGAGLKLAIQYWTSRGIAVVDVNYGGSSGFGRDYRRLLNGEWGVVDVEDCIAAAKALASNGQVDPQRMLIRGGSAGGLTVLRALQSSKDFAGGTSLYGVSDLELLAGDTHKFESRYLDGLLGGAYPAHKATYVARSPIHHCEQLNCPILVLQGDEDKVVPPNQSAAIVAAAAKKGLPHAYVLFEGEQHGFRQTHNIIRALQIELWFYARVLGFTPDDDIAAPAEAVGL